jgi:hypothetical protein
MVGDVVLEHDDMAYLLRMNGAVVEINREEYDDICMAGDERNRAGIIAQVLRARFWRVK